MSSGDENEEVDRYKMEILADAITRSQGGNRQQIVSSIHGAYPTYKGKQK
jgi:hypothetical protein